MFLIDAEFYTSSKVRAGHEFLCKRCFANSYDTPTIIALPSKGNSPKGAQTPCVYIVRSACYKRNWQLLSPGISGFCISTIFLADHWLGFLVELHTTKALPCRAVHFHYQNAQSFELVHNGVTAYASYASLMSA